MATSLRDAPLCHHNPRQVEHHLHALHVEWQAEQHLLKQNEYRLFSLHQHQAQLRLLAQERLCGKAPALVTKLAEIEAQIAQTQTHLADLEQRCQELAAQFDVVQVALAAVRHQARQRSARSVWSVLKRVGRRLCQGVKQTALSELRAWEKARWF